MLKPECRKISISGVIAIITAGWVVAVPSVAQNVLMDDILVTAQRREEVAQDIPIAVTAYDSEQLERLQVTETLDMTKLVPNLIGHNNTGLGTANTYSLRGLNNTESIATFDPPVGSYVDDIYVTRQNANNFTLFDVDRIEVLRGPQGTLFGRNTTGGAVRVILKKPAEEFGGNFELGFGEFSRFLGKGSVDIPISERVLTKFSAYYIEDDGFVTSRTTGEDNINAEENYGLRGHVLFNISDALAWDVAVDYIENDHANMLNFKDGNNRVSATGLSKNNSNLVGLLTGSKQAERLGNRVETFSATSVLSWDIGDAGNLEFITGWRDLEQKFALDFCDNRRLCVTSALPNNAPWGSFTIANDGNHEQFTQEIKWASDLGEAIDYVAGIFYLKEENTTDFGDIFDVGIPLILADRILDNEAEALAAYLQADWSVTDRVTFTIGARYTDEEKTIAVNDNRPCLVGNTGGCNFDDDGNPATPGVFIDTNGDGIDDFDLVTANFALTRTPNPTDPGNADADLFQKQPLPTKQTEKIWTPRIAINFSATDDLNVYASATRGFKSGGWNARGTDPSTLLNFDSEKVWSYEVGMKSEWLDNTLRLNLNAYYTEVTDYQLPSAFPSATGGIVFVTQNFADLENLGLELDVLFAPTDELSLFANIGIQDAEYKNIDPEIVDQQQECLGTGIRCGQGIVNPDGQIAEPVRAPDYTMNAGFNYVYPIGSSLELIPGGYVYKIGNHSVGTSGGPESLNTGYTTWNGSVALNNLDHDWSLTLECKNCNDRTMVVSTLAGFQYLQDPRTWMLRFRKNFGAN